MATRLAVSGLRAATTALCTWLGIVAVPNASAQIVVPAGASVQIGTGAVSAGGVDVRVGGQLQLQSGTLQGLRHVDVQPSGSLDNGSGHIRLAGDWRNAGHFIGAGGAVEFIDGLGLTSAQISGNSAFFNLSFVSTIGKHYVFAVGSVQTVAGLLGIQGTSALPIQFQSSLAGEIAALNLLPGGTQNIAHVGVTDVYATGQPLAPALTNEGGHGNAIGWFGNTAAAFEPTPIPTLSTWSIALLSAFLAALAYRRLTATRRARQGVPS